MEKCIAIVDYGLGNIRSAEQSFIKVVKENNLNAKVIITNNAKDIYLSSHIILPGQGAFVTCMNGLKNIQGMIDASMNTWDRQSSPRGMHHCIHELMNS